MRSTPSSFQAFIEMKGNRRKKKQKLYKVAMGIGFDLTISIYLGAFLIIGFLILYDTMKQYHADIVAMESMISSNYLSFFMLFLMKSLVAAYRSPGVLFSSAELYLSLLPYSRNRLWLYCVIEKWIKSVSLVIILVLGVGTITAFTYPFLLRIGCLYILAQVLMTIPQWKLYQYGIFYKIVIVVAFGISAGFLRLLLDLYASPVITLFSFVFILCIVNLFLYKQVLKQVNWMKVIRSNDLLIWNMWFINKMSGVQIKPSTKQGLIQNIFRSKRAKRPFTYTNASIYRRLWRNYFFDQKDKVLQAIGSMLVILILLQTLDEDWVLGLAIAASIFLFGQLASSFFYGGFDERLIFSLPWDMKAWKKAYFYWLYFPGILLLLIIIVILITNTEAIGWIPLQLIFYGYVGIYFTDILINQKIALLGKFNELESIGTMFVTIFLFLFVVLSISYPYIAGTVIILFLFHRRNNEWQRK